jgi:group II intron reverse transcriptase/maturase
MKSGSVYTKQQRIAELAKRLPEVSFTSLAYHIDHEWLKEAYHQTRKDAAVGVDGVTAHEYEEQLEDNLQLLLERFKSGAYRAQPVRRVYIPKSTSVKEQRPLGIPVLEDKILERAVKMVAEPLYEQDFLYCSYGFRPGRSVHKALDMLWKEAMGMRGCWVLEVDIRRFYDTMKHEYLRTFLKRRVCDGVIVRTVGKWLKAGVMEAGAVHYDEEGSPQGRVISPLLSNVYLHDVLDEWFTREIVPRLNHRASLVRFADDAVLLFADRHEAEVVKKVLIKRFAKYGLELHPEKTRLVKFTMPPLKGKGEAGSFDFLGFTHYWGRSRRGLWVIKRKTSGKKFRAAVKRVNQWCKKNRHKPVKEQHKALSVKLRGHYNFYGITCNIRSLNRFKECVQLRWRKWLNRRKRPKGRGRLTFEKFTKLLERYKLPSPYIAHTYA